MVLYAQPKVSTRYSDNFTEQVGSAKGACGTALETNVMIMTLDPCSHDEADCSPAYAALQRYEISSLDMQQLYRGSIDNTDDRKAVCDWLVDNLDRFERTVVPQTYPRTMRQGSFYQHYTRATMFVAVLAIVLVLLCAFASKHYQKTKVMVSPRATFVNSPSAQFQQRLTLVAVVQKYAQVDFLLFILAGLFMVALSAVLYSVKPTNGSCIARTWFMAIGYSLELIPLAVKVAA